MAMGLLYQLSVLRYRAADSPIGRHNESEETLMEEENSSGRLGWGSIV